MVSPIFTQEIENSEIIWDEWEVPHIYAKNEADLFYFFGRAQMKLHANLLLKKYGEARGRAAEYWGKDFLKNDLIIKKLDIPNRSEKWFEAQNGDMKSNLAAFVNGINDYANIHPDEIDESLKVVLPIKVSDLFSLLQYSYHYKVGAFAVQSQLEQWKNAGSNAWAIAPSKSKNGNSMLLIQPHPPWMDDYRFLEAHLVTDNMNIYGIAQVGSPIIAMGFNENLGWGLTFNQADTYDLYEIELTGEGYNLDGKYVPLKIRKEVYSYKEDGKIITDTLYCKSSVHGNILEEKGGKAIALRLSGLDAPYMTQQFLEMAKSKNRLEFKQAVSKLQLPLQNIVYADKHGEIEYIYNGIIPKRGVDNYGYWNSVQNGNASDNIVKEYLIFEELPKFSNPKSGFISSTNNPPWSTTYPAEINPKDYPGYIAPNFMDERTVRSLRMLTEVDKVSFEDLEKMQGNKVSELAVKYRLQLVEYAMNSNDSLLTKAATVLKNWDEKTNPDSKGAVLFAQWYFSARKEFPGNSVNIEEALNGNNVLSDEAKQVLLKAAEIVSQKYGKLDIVWGEVYRIFHAGNKYPSSIGLNELGNFHAGFYRPDHENKFTLLGGVAFSLIVEFDKKVKAKALLPYGNSTQNPNGKQILLMNEGKMREVKFYKDDLGNN